MQGGEVAGGKRNREGGWGEAGRRGRWMRRRKGERNKRRWGEKGGR